MFYPSIQRFLIGSLILISSATLAENGVGNNEIILGQSTALTGSSSDTALDFNAGALAYFNYVNAQGGIHGRKIVLKSLDDSHDAKQAADNTKKLIDTEKVFALFGYYGNSCKAAEPIFTEAKVPTIACITGSTAIREPFNRLYIHIRASHKDEINRITLQLVALGLVRIAVLRHDDENGKSQMDLLAQSLGKLNLKIIADGKVDSQKNDVTDAVKAISDAEVQAVVILASAKSASAFIQAMKKAKHFPQQYIAFSSIGDKAFIKEAGLHSAGVGISQVVPFPWVAKLPIVQEYRKNFIGKTKNTPSFSSLEGYISAKVLSEGLRRTGKNLTRGGLVQTMENMGTYDMGGMEVSYSPAHHLGSKFVEVVVINKEGKFMR